MRFEFIADEHVKVKTFLRRHEISKSLLAKIKFSGGNILVNHQPQNAIYLLDIGDKVTIDIPSEKGFESLMAVDKDLSVIYEDEHFLVLDKPEGVASIPVLTIPILWLISSRLTIFVRAMKTSRCIS